MNETQPEVGAQAEIAKLEALLREKKAALEAGDIPEKSEKEVFHEVWGEAYPKPTPSGSTESPAPAAVPSTPQQHPQPATSLDPAHENQVNALLEFAFAKGIHAAIEAAGKESPWLLDELHDRLRDRYYDELLRSRKIQAL